MFQYTHINFVNICPINEEHLWQSSNFTESYFFIASNPCVIVGVDCKIYAM